MANNTSILFGRYNIFSKMDSAVDIHPTAYTVVRSSYLSYYVAIVVALLVAYLFKFTRQQKHLDMPFYKAAKTKWIFDAETLVRDSYNKVFQTLSIGLIYMPGY